MSELRPYQQLAIDAFRDSPLKRKLIVMSTGLGKCLGRGTPVLLHDGTIIPVEEITTNHVLAAPSSGMRKVLSTCTGHADMYRVTPTKGESFVCNDVHVLSLVDTVTGVITDIPLNEYLTKSSTFKHRNKLFRTSVEAFSGDKNLPVDPYFYGLWLADGTKSLNVVAISKPDVEVLDTCNAIAASYGLSVSTGHSPGSCPTHRITSGNTGGKPNALLDAMRKLWPEIPISYLTSPVADRLSFLAGILDGDGCLTIDECGFDFISKYKNLSDAVCFVARSVGLAAYSKQCTKSCQNGFTGTYWRVSISGDTSIIPVRIPRRKPKPRKQKKNALRTGFRVEKIGQGEYFGFTLDGDGRFLLGDFTVTHNTFTGLALARQMNTKTLWLAHTQELVDQPFKTAEHAWPGVSRGIVRAEQNQYMRDMVFASIQSAQQPHRMEQLSAQGFGLVIVDEAHHVLSAGYKDLLRALGCFSNTGPQLLGLTATPERSDNAPLDEVFEGIVFQMGITSAIEQGYLVPPKVVTRKIAVDLDAITVSRGDYGQKQLDIALMKAGIVKEICDGYEEHCVGRKTIAFVISVDQAEQVSRMLCDRGYRFASVSGQTDKEDRKRILKRLKTGELDGVVNCMVLTEGFDEPSVSAIILGRPTQSKPLTIQKIGRGLRLFPDKTDCLVLDMVGSSKRHSMIQAAVLFGAEQEEKPKTGNGFNPITQPEDYWRERMRSQIEGVGGAPRSILHWVPGSPGWLLDAGVYGAVRMQPNGELWNVDAVGVSVGAQKRIQLSDAPVDMETAQAIAEDYVRRVNAVNKAVSDAAWRNREASATDVKNLRRSGVKVVEGISRGTAADLSLQTRAVQAVTPATSKQLYYLRLHGIKFEPGLTKREAQGLIVKSTFRKKAQ